ncbi:discoidin domain-containing protein [Nitrospira sp. Nam74]
MLRKHIVKQDPSETVPPATSASMISIPDVASVLVSSEDPLHPIDHVFDDHNGPGGTRWLAGEVGEQTIILAFDRPQRLQKVNLEIEESEVSRTQEVSLAVSVDEGHRYHEILRQEYNFSPPNTTFEREWWAVPVENMTHLRLVIKPDKGDKPSRATVTSLKLQ